MFPNVALIDGMPPEARRPEARTALFAGNLLPLKGVALAIDALTYLPAGTWCSAETDAMPLGCGGERSVGGCRIGCGSWGGSRGT